MIGDARAHGIGQRDPARLVHRHQPWYTQRRIGTKCQRIEEIVIDTPIDHINAPRSAGGAHVDVVVVDKQVLSFYQFNAHLLGEERVFEIG